VAVWGLGLFFEAVGDWQLALFKSDPANKGKIMDRGLWAFTRHPNYFGDAAVWWGHYLVAAAAGGWWTVLSPLAMTVLLMRVSGVTLLESALAKRPGYQDYIARTSAFFPRPPRKLSGA
jgi:steroid 5-alpha reductase family enzyme